MTCPRRQRVGLVLGLAALSTIAAAGCAAAPPRGDHPVLLEPEDETAPARGLTCRVAGQVELEGRATLAPPALAAQGQRLALAWVVRDQGTRRIRLQQVGHDLRPPAAALDLPALQGMPISLQLGACGPRLLVAWQDQTPQGDSIQLVEVEGDPLAATPPLTVAPQGTQPTLACAQGRGALAWAVDEDGLRDIFLRWVEPRGELGPPLRVSGETDAAVRPTIACQGERCALAWSDRRAVYAEIYGAVLEAGATEGPAEVVRISTHDQTDSGAGGAYAPDLAATTEGRFLVGWHDNRTHDESEIYVVGLSEALRPGAEQRISRSPAPSTEAALASCREGQGAVAWRDRRYGAPAVMFAALDGQARRGSEALRLSDAGADETSAPRAACLDSETVAVAWTEADAEGAGSLRLAVVRCQ